MKIKKLLNLISVLLLLTMIGNMLLLPGAVQAQPQAVPPAVASVVAGGERFMDAAPQALGRALQLAQRLDYISQVELADLSETTLIQARQDALATAEQAATAQGSVGAIANGLTELDYQVQAAANMSTEVANLESNGFDAELESALADLGLTSGQIGELEDEAAANFTVRGSLPAETVTLLQEAGLSQAEIDEIEATLTDYGLADNTLADRLAQFRASQEELSIVRTQSLVAYLQLLTKQVFVRQLAGETGRDLSTTEVDEVVKDQLRLLIHLGYLDNLWNGNPNPDVGEGQWLFVERYSLRVAERLDALILETQNLGLIVDLLVALQLHSTALAALAGDADYAQAEVEPLADFLETMLGDNLPGSQGYRHAAPPFWWGSALAMGDYNPAVLSGYEPELEPEAVAVTQEQAQERIKGLAYPLWFPVFQVNDPDPSNNRAIIVFHTASPSLPPGVLDVLIPLMGGSTPTEFLWELLTGQSDNPYAIGGNIVLSMIPIEGEILDLIALFTEPTPWGKAFACIGLVTSLLTDGLAALTALSVAIPPALAALGSTTVAGKVIDVGAVILRNVKAITNAATYEIIRHIPFKKALELGGEMLGHLGRRAVDAVGGIDDWPSSSEQVLSLIRSQLNPIWEAFTTLVNHYGQARLNKLFELGFGEGGFLAGRALKKVGNFSDETLLGVKNISKDLDQTAYNFSDEVAAGLGKTVDDIGEGPTRRVLDFAGCLVGSLSYRGKVAGLASPLLDTDPECNIAKAVFEISQQTAVKFSESALKGISNLVKLNGKEFVENALQRMGQKGYSSEVINTTFTALDSLSPGTLQWSDQAMDGLALVIKKAGDQTGNLNKAREIAQAVIARHQWTGHSANQVFQLLDELGDVYSPRYDTWVKGLADALDNNVRAALFELRYSVELKKSGAVIDTLEDYKNNNQAMDLILSESGDEIWVELKNSTSESVSKMKEQLEKRLGIKPSDVFYGPGNYEYVFAGPPSESYVNALCSVAREAVNRGLLNDEQFAKFTIKFMGWPQSIEGLLQTTSLAVEPISVVGCRR